MGSMFSGLTYHSPSGLLRYRRAQFESCANAAILDRRVTLISLRGLGLYSCGRGVHRACVTVRTLSCRSNVSATSIGLFRQLTGSEITKNWYTHSLSLQRVRHSPCCGNGFVRVRRRQVRKSPAGWCSYRYQKPSA